MNKAKPIKEIKIILEKLTVHFESVFCITFKSHSL